MQPSNYRRSRHRWLHPLLLVRIVVALPFFGAGLAKLAGVAPMVALFDQVGLGQWFRYATGLLEVLGAIALVTAAWPLGAVLLACVARGALAVIGGNPLPAVVLLIASATLAALGIRQHLTSRRRRFA